MKRLAVCLSLAFAALLLGSAPTAEAGWPHLANHWGYRFANTQPWNGGYYHTSHGHPVPLVVPPTANMQVKWGWGVAQSETVPIYHQYQRAYPGPFGGGGGVLSPTPHWPSHSDQFGVYYARGPW
jgi:hypothetical protein